MVVVVTVKGMKRIYSYINASPSAIDIMNPSPSLLMMSYSLVLLFPSLFFRSVLGDGGDLGLPRLK